MSEMITNEQAIEMIAELTKQLEELKKSSAAEPKIVAKGVGMKKNQKPGKADPSRKYVLLKRELESWGKVPQQQSDIAKLLVNNLEVNKEYTESEVFSILTEKYAEYSSLANSVQDPTWLFRYYRGLKNDGKRAGYIARNFLRVL